MKELLFAQRLADNERKIRDRALKKLKKYLSIKTSVGPALSQDETLKLWKGLFYCMYMADKPLFQEHVAEEICSLIHYINNEEDCKSFVRAGFLTFAREWNGIDVFRIEKYMMFVRRFLRHIFTHLKASDWNLKKVLAYTHILEMTVVCPDDDVNKTSLGLKTHVCEIILEELAKIGGENLQHRVIMAVIQPYFKVLALTKIKAYIKFVREGIIHHLIRQSYSAEEEEEAEEEESITVEINKTAPETGDKVMDDIMCEERDEAAMVLDPRAGKVDAYLPQLKVDFSLLADSLQKVGAVARVQAKNREVIYRLVCELRDAAQGQNPLSLPSDHLDDIEVPDSEVEEAVERLEKFEEDLKVGKVLKHEDSNDDDLKALKKEVKHKYKKSKYFGLKKKKNQKPKGLSKAAKRKVDKRQKELAQKRAKAVDHMVRQVTAASGVPRNSLLSLRHEEQTSNTHGFEVSLISQKKKKSTAAKASVNSFMVEVASDFKKKRKNIVDTNKASKKQCFDVSFLDLKSNEVSETNCAEKNGSVHIEQAKRKNNSAVKKGNKKSVKSEDMIKSQTKVDKSMQKNDTHKIEHQVPIQMTTDIMVDKPSVQPSSVEAAHGSKAEVIQDSVSSKGNSAIRIPEGMSQRSQKPRPPKTKSPWDEPLRNGEYEIFVKSRKQITKSKRKKISPIKKRITASIPKQRTISINLKKNKEHEFSDYVRTIRASPSIPFKADQAPKAPVLKPSPSPILVKGPLLRKRLQKMAAVSASPKLNHKKNRHTAADYF